VADYDAIGEGYARVRSPDDRIADHIRRALGDVRSVVNVGAGAGSYEPRDLEVVAVEPSVKMIDQRPPGSAHVIQGRAEHLPFPDGAFDVALAVLTVHHWDDWRVGLAEMKRVARRRVVVLTWDPPAAAGFWLNDYFPEMAAVDARRFVPLDEFCEPLRPCDVSRVPIPQDCTDGFMAAYWRRPRAYLDPEVRAGISSFSLGVDTEAGPSIGRWGRGGTLDPITKIT
jgi:SAM-dependent methyltransferase